MDGNPEGTPNPLNPVVGTANPVDEPSSSTDMATGTGTLGYIETEIDSPNEAVETTEVVETIKEEPETNTVDQYAAARPASFAQTNQSFSQRPMHTNYSTVDPMMRPVSKPNPTEMGTIVSTTTAPTTPAVPVSPAAPVSPATPTSPSPTIPSRAESNFDTFAMKDTPNMGQSADSMAEQNNLVAKDSIVESKGGKKKRGLIIGAIVFIMIAIICGAAAVAIIMLNNNDDRITKAIDKLLSGQMPSIVEAKGTINSTYKYAPSNKETIAAEPAKIASSVVDFDGTFDTKSSMSRVDATLTVNYDDESDIEADISELSTKEGDVYFKVAGLTDLFSASMASADNTFDKNCTSGNTNGDVDTADNCISIDTTATVAPFGGLFEAADDEWILVSGDFTDTMESLTIFDNTSTCLINSLGTLSEYASDIASKYKANPFITYSTDNLKITKRKNNLYRLGIDSVKLGAFANSLSNNGFVNELNACVNNTATNSETNSTLFDGIFANFPTVYAEVDENNNFTRLYFDITMASDNGDSTSTTADLNLIYPSEFKITEPTDYIEMSSLLSSTMSELFTNNTSETIETSEAIDISE